MRYDKFIYYPFGRGLSQITKLIIWILLTQDHFSVAVVPDELIEKLADEINENGGE